MPEVYELKTIIEPEYREGSWLDKHIPGAIRQRQGYIEALTNMGIRINKKGTSLNSVINGKVLHSAKYDKDILYVIDPFEYGIVYWSYVGRKQNYDEIKEWMLHKIEKSYIDKCEKEEQEDNVIQFPTAKEENSSIAAMWAEINDNLYSSPEYQNARDQLDQMANLLRLLEMVTERAFPLVPLPPEEALPGKWDTVTPHIA